MTRTKPFAELAAHAKADARRRERIEEHKRAINLVLSLAELRETRGATQQQVAEDLHSSQANISRIEHQDDLLLSTLRGYVSALGGRLEVTAVFPEQRITLWK